MTQPDSTPVTVHARLLQPHPLVASTQQAAASRKPDETGRLILQGDIARFKVSRPALPRALRILDALCKAAEARRWSVQASRRYSGGPNMIFTNGMAKVEFDVIEETTRVRHVRTPAEDTRSARSGSSGIPEWDYTLTGRLRLRLDHYLSKRANFTDGVRRSLDDQLGEVLNEVGRIFDAEGERDAEREREQQVRQQQRVDAIEEAYLDLIEDRRLEAVTALMTDWRLARDLRQYAEQVRATLAEMTPEARQRAGDWLAWVQPHLHGLEAAVAAPGLPPDPRRNDVSLAPLIAGRGGNDAWLEWLDLNAG
jgi:hypothetical protein